jgi:GDPmannose 4,6-dehydratase
MPRALITGITGQDGSYLTELLLAKGYDVHGIIRRASSFNTGRLEHLYEDQHNSGVRLFLHYGDLTDGGGLRRLIHSIAPDELYHLGAQSQVRVSFDEPEYTADVVGIGTLRILESIRDFEQVKGRQIKMYQAGSSEMFGSSPAPQSETTPFHPRSPYAVSKAAAHWYAVNYREAYRLFVSNGILFNHESPRRGETFVTRKITRAVGRIKFGLQDRLFLGNLDARRDWGFAGDYVDAIWRMLQSHAPSDFVVATGQSHSVRQFLDAAFQYAGLEWERYVLCDPRYYRPTEVDLLLGDASKARAELGWAYTTRFEELVHLMVDADMVLAEREASSLGVRSPRSVPSGLEAAS